MKYIGIDFGTKRIGIAISDENATLAFPKKVLENKGDGAIREILELCKKEDVGGILVGKSENLKGEDNPLMKHINKFVDEWKKQSSIPVYFESEYFSSHQSQHIQGMNAMTDASAASIILQSFLDKEKSKKAEPRKIEELPW
jgi:putative Holliday junction resolvase